MKKRILCRNEKNTECVFDYDFNPFFLVSAEGLYSVKSTLQTAANSMTDGSTYMGGVIDEREIVITAQYHKNYKENRDFLFKMFRPKSRGVLLYEENGETREIDYIVENIEVEEKGVIRDITLDLVCTNPFFRDSDYKVAIMQGIIGMFEFPHEFLDSGEEFGCRVHEQIKEIENRSSVERIGMEIIIEALSFVVNPRITKVRTMEYIEADIKLKAGDVLRITTGTNEKGAILMRNGEETNVNAAITPESEFIQLEVGKNMLQYAAVAGKDNMNVEIRYRQKYIGV